MRESICEKALRAMRLVKLRTFLKKAQRHLDFETYTKIVY